jgi:hypothetical protein
VTPPRILGGHSKKSRIPVNSPKNQNHPVINSTSLIIIAIEPVIFLINYPPLSL